MDFLFMLVARQAATDRARTTYADFRNRRESVSHKIEAYSIDAEKKYETRVTTSLDVASFLIAQAHPFRGHDESPSSLNRGNFLEMIEWHKKGTRGTACI
jgi:hypothetical protein